MAIIFFLAIIFSTSHFPVNASEDLSGIQKNCFGNSTKIYNSRNYNFLNNVNSLLSLLVSESSSSHPPLYFFNTSFGRVSPRVYGSYLCRGDLSFDKCQSCLVNVTQFLPTVDIDGSECFGFDFIWCMVRYSNTSHYSVYEKGHIITYQPMGENVTNYQKYNETLSNTIQGLITEASYGNWTKANFATKAVKVTGSTNQEVFALVQCTPDISPVNCSNCLKELYSDIPDYMAGKQGGVLVHANCFMKYNNHSFFGSANRSFLPGCFLVSLALLLSMYLFM